MKLATEVERATIVRRSIFGAEIIEAVPVQAIRKDFHVLLGLFDRSTEILPLGKNFHQTAGVSRIEMLHEHVCHAHIGRNAQEALKK